MLYEKEGRNENLKLLNEMSQFLFVEIFLRMLLVKAHSAFNVLLTVARTKQFPIELEFNTLFPLVYCTACNAP